MAKVLVSINDDLLKAVDAAASELGMTRSAYLCRLAARETAVADGPGRSPEARNAMARLRRLSAYVPPGTDSAAVIREERDARTDRLAR